MAQDTALAERLRDDVADGLLDRFGERVVWNVRGASPAEGVPAYIGPVDSSMIDGADVLAGDAVVILAGDAVDPAPAPDIRLRDQEGRLWRVVRAGRTVAAGIDVIHECTARLEGDARADWDGDGAIDGDDERVRGRDPFDV